MHAKTLFETLEGRRLMTAAVGDFKWIGQTPGLVAAATGPGIASITSPAKLGNAARDLTITLAIDTAGGAVKTTTLFPSAVELYELNADGSVRTKITAIGNPQTSGGGDTISVTPDSPLKPNTSYTFVLNPSGLSSTLKIRNVSNVIFPKYTFTFTTGTQIAIADPRINFVQQDSGAQAAPYTAVTIGPDDKLYAATMQGYIYRWNIDSDGTLSGRQTITSVLDNNTDANNTAGNRIITGITFDPSSTAGNLKLWVSHGQYHLGTTPSFGTALENYADNYTGKVSLLSGANLATYRDMIVHIPRSVKDHLNNQIVFDRSGNNFHFVIPSMSAMGKADAVWGNQEENVLTAAMFKVNLAKLNNEVTTTGPVDLDPSANYDVYDSANAMTIYASGIRNAYDMVFHSNGHLYSATNGSSAGGNTPSTPSNLATVPSTKRLDYATDGAYDGGAVVGKTNVLQTEQDLLLDVKQGVYYGHPNPARGEYVLNAGNTTGDKNDPFQYTSYALGTQPDRNYQAGYDLGKNVSPDGMIEYQSNTFGGLLAGSLLIARYNGGQDILAVKPNSDGSISKSGVQARILGLTGLESPLDLVENTTNGSLYAVELNEKGMTGAIKLMTPTVMNPDAEPSTNNKVPYRVVTYPSPGNRKGATNYLIVTNTGTTTLEIDPDLTRLSGPKRGNFQILNFPTAPLRVLPGESTVFNVRGVLGRGETAERANLLLKINKPGQDFLTIQLRASYVPTSTTAAIRSNTGLLQKMFATSAFSASSVKKDDGWLLEDLF